MWVRRAGRRLVRRCGGTGHHINTLNLLYKTSGVPSWSDAGASSAQTITGAGYMETTIYDTGNYRMVGLSDVDSDQSFVSIDYAIQLANNNWAYIYESGVYRGQFVAFGWNDKFRVERFADGHVEYKKNGATFYTSSVISTADLRADTSLYTPGTTVSAVVLSSQGGPARAVDWINEVGVRQGGNLASSTTLMLADVNGDGRKDAVLRRRWASVVAPRAVDGTFGEHRRVDAAFRLERPREGFGCGRLGRRLVGESITGTGYVGCVAETNGSG